MFKFRCYSCGVTMGSFVPAEALSLEQSLAVGGDVPMEYISPLVGSKFDGMSMGSFCTFCQWMLVNHMPVMEGRHSVEGHKMRHQDKAMVCECNTWKVPSNITDSSAWINRLMMIHAAEVMEGEASIPGYIIDLTYKDIVDNEL